MKVAGVKAKQKKRFKSTTNSNHGQPVFENHWIESFLLLNRIKFMHQTSLMCGLRKAGFIWQ